MIDYKILDAWEAKYIRNLPDKEVIAWSDAEAVKKYPKLKWVYDKLELHNYLDSVPTWDLWNSFPKKYPVFVKPRININGMGYRSEIINSEFELFDKGLIGTHIAQPILTGDHITTDIVFDGKEVVDYFSFYCHYNRYGSFSLFESVKELPNKNIIDKLSKIGIGRRIFNIETIGGKPLELHLRPSVQFYDISGGIMSQMPGFVMGDDWHKAKREKTYSKIYRTRRDCRMARPMPAPPRPRGVRSVQFCWENQQRLSKHTNDPYSLRYMVINGSNLRAISSYGSLLKDLIKIYP